MASTEEVVKPEETAPAEVKDPAPAIAATGEDGEEAAPDEECQAEFKPVVELQEVDTKTGEEEEEILYKERAKLFRHDKEEGGWKERGLGEVKILKHKENKRIRLLMRREKTLKICLNHYVNSDTELQENFGSERSWVWSAVDYADGERDECVLAIRFANSEVAATFRTEYDKARDFMRDLLASEEKAEKTEEKTEETTEEKTEEEKPEEKTEEEKPEEKKEE